MKIFDCFIFFNELELLELRLMTLYNVVDYFVLVEAGTTFTGNEKEMYYEKNKNLFEKYSDKIIYISVDKLPYSDAWENEFYNRNLIIQGLSSANDNDYIIISDVDEIPNPDAILEGINNNYDIFKLKQKLFYYYVNCIQNQEWFGTVVIKKKYVKSPQDTRLFSGRDIKIINNGGWHYSFLGDKDRIKLKLESYSEIQTNNVEINNEEHIIKCLESGIDLFNRNDEIFKKRFVSLEEVNHKELKEWVIKYPNFIKI